MDHRTDQPAPQPSPRTTAHEPLGDLISADAIHTNPAAPRVRAWMTVDVAAQLAAGADQDAEEKAAAESADRYIARTFPAVAALLAEDRPCDASLTAVTG